MAKGDLESYIAAHSTPESPLLDELFRTTHTSVINPNMASGHLQGQLLGMFVRMTGARLVLEIGTFTGYAAICMASALPQGGTVHTIEINDELHDLALGYIRRAGLEGSVVMHTGDARSIIPGLDCMFDMVFIDGDKREYCDYYDAAFPKVRPGGFIIADNVLWGGKVLENTRDAMTLGIQAFNEKVAADNRVDNLILPVRDGLMVVWKK